MKREFYLNYFSPTWDRKKYIRILKGFTDEFCHNLYRVIMRPNCSSTWHWIDEMYTWFDITLGSRLPIKNKPIEYLFSYLADNTKGIFELGSNSRLMIRIVSRERMYGDIINSDIEYIESKVRELYELLDPSKVYEPDESTKVLLDWYKSINGSNSNLIPV